MTAVFGQFRAKVSASEYSWNWSSGQPGEGMISAGTVPLTLRLRAFVPVSEDDIFLSDIADCYGDGGFCAEADSLFIGVAPPPGESQEITREQILALVQAEWPFLRIEMEGRPRVSIESEVRVVTDEAVKSGLQKLLTSFSARFPELRFTLTGGRLQRAWKVRPGFSFFAFPDLKNDRLLEKSRLVRKYRRSLQVKVVLVYPDSAKKQTENIYSARVLTEVRALVALTDMGAGQRVTKEDFGREWVPWEKTLPGLPGKIKWEEDFSLRRQLRAGHPLKENDLNKIPLIKRGQMVNLQMRDQGLDISVQVKALGKGGRGDTIKVVYLPSQKTLTGRIISPGVLEHTGGQSL